MKVRRGWGGGGEKGEKKKDARMKWDHKDGARLRNAERGIRQVFRLLSHMAITLGGRLCPRCDSGWTQQGHIRTLM